MDWQEALEKAESSGFASYTDWRLPKVEELLLIVAYDRNNPIINSTIFPNTSSEWFWSSSPYPDSSHEHACVVNFSLGLDSYGTFESSHRVLLVRSI